MKRNNNQGKRPDQYESSMKIFVWTFIVFLAIVVIRTIIEIVKNL